MQQAGGRREFAVGDASNRIIADCEYSVTNVGCREADRYVIVRISALGGRACSLGERSFWSLVDSRAIFVSATMTVSNDMTKSDAVSGHYGWPMIMSNER